MNMDSQIKKSITGSYFVSNYPHYRDWTVGNVPQAQLKLNQQQVIKKDFGLYCHIPFCRKRCHFCYFKVEAGKNSAYVKEYVTCFEKEILLYASKPFLDKRELTFIYCGGGTPSYLSQAQIEHIFRLLCDNFSCSHLKEVTFECEPGTLTNAKLKTLKEVGGYTTQYWC